jgi:hypothetical protein
MREPERFDLRVSTERATPFEQTADWNEFFDVFFGLPVTPRAPDDPDPGAEAVPVAA